VVNTLGVDIIPHAPPEELVKMWFDWSGGRGVLYDGPKGSDGKARNRFGDKPAWESHVGIKVSCSHIRVVYNVYKPLV